MLEFQTFFLLKIVVRIKEEQVRRGLLLQRTPVSSATLVKIARLNLRSLILSRERLKLILSILPCPVGSATEMNFLILPCIWIDDEEIIHL